MAGSGDRRAAAWLLLVAAAGLVVRFWQPAAQAPGAIAYRPAERSPPRDSVAARAVRLGRPLSKGERVDLDRASAEELARLPRIGPGLAARIVADREARGPFGSLEGLDRVSGIGPSVLEAIRPYAAFSGPVWEAPPAGPLPLNSATARELERLPGVGPALARAIVEDRARRGPYRSLADLRRVRGVGPALLRALADRVVVP